MCGRSLLHSSTIKKQLDASATLAVATINEGGIQVAAKTGNWYPK